MAASFRSKACSLALVVAATACTGDVKSSGPRAGAAGAAGNSSAGSRGGADATAGAAGAGDFGIGGTGGAPALPPPEVGTMALRRLTRSEYNKTLGDLLGFGVNVADSFTPEIPASSGFSTAGLINELEVQQFQRGAEQVAAQAATKLDKLVPCAVATVGEKGCAEQLVRTLGKRAYRRPLADDEVAMHLAFYQDQLRGTLALSHAEAMPVLLAAMLQSPAFLYHWERGPGVIAGASQTKVPLGSWEIASRLSYFLWETMPDPELFADADKDALRDPAMVEKHARRLLASPRAEPVIRRFHLEWLHVYDNLWPKDGDKYPLWVGGIDHAAATDVLSSLGYVMTKGDGTWGSLLTSPVAFVTTALAKVYGIDGVTNTNSFQGQQVMLDPKLRPGLLTRVGVLASGANAIDEDPIRRGKLVRTQLLCQTLMPPPMVVPPLPVDAKLSVRARHAAHAKDPGCASCHNLMDGIGNGFTAYDATGAYHATDASGAAIDDSGLVKNIDGGDKPFHGPAELTQILADSVEAKRCLARQWVRFALGRELEDADESAFDDIYAAFEQSKFDVREVLIAATRSKSFLNRAPQPGEVLP